METLKKYFFLTLGLAIIIWSFYHFLNSPAPARYQNVSTWQVDDLKVLRIGERSISVEIADTDEERGQGLSGRESLEAGRGLLFVFETPGPYGFWMKDMKFPIDIIWIDEEWRVVGVEREVTPETFPQIFLPKSPVKYVLELNAGEAAKLGIDTGSKVSRSR